MLIIQCENLVKIYKVSDIEVVALQGLDLDVEKGEVMGIIGNSGSGKSTLLNMIGGLDRPSAGRLVVDDRDLLKMSDSDLVRYKRDVVGFVWQNNARNLIPYLTAQENIELPMLIKGASRKDKAAEMLERVGLLDRRHNKLNELSGGEQQRVAIAIALTNNPKILLADEPTGNVDTKMADIILDIFNELSRDLGLTVIIVTHDVRLSRKVNRVVAIRDGKTSSEYVRKKTYSQELSEIKGGFAEKSDGATHEEFAILDKAGRLQIPREYLETIGADKSRRVKVELEDGRIILAVTEQEKLT